MGASRDCQQCYYEWWSLWGGEMLLDVWYNKTKWDQEVIVQHFTYTLWCHTCHKILSRLAGEAHSISGSLDRRWHKAVLFMPRPRPRQSSQVPITLSGDLWRCWMPLICWWPRRSLFSVHQRSDEAVKYPTIPYCMGHDHPMGSLPTVSSNPHRHPTIDDSAADYALRDHFKDCRRYVFLLCFFTKTLFVLQRIGDLWCTSILPHYRNRRCCSKLSWWRSRLMASFVPDMDRNTGVLREYPVNGLDWPHPNGSGRWEVLVALL